jgi:hypothetical protein
MNQALRQYDDIDPPRPAPLYHGYHFVCRPETPWDGKARPAAHPRAVSLHYGDPYRDWYHCPVCNTTFSVEVPE